MLKKELQLKTEAVAQAKEAKKATNVEVKEQASESSREIREL